jgi:hypothetical protein
VFDTLAEVKSFVRELGRHGEIYAVGGCDPQLRRLKRLTALHHTLIKRQLRLERRRHEAEMKAFQAKAIW